MRPGSEPIELGVEQRDLEIDYTALSFLAPGNVRFRYRLEPYDDGWVDAGSRRTAFYTQVRPGRYTFRVRASIDDGVWSEAGASLALHLLPRFHETGRFRLLALAAAGLLIATGFGWRVRRLRLRTHELGRLVDERTAALRQKETQLEAQNSQLGELYEARSHLFANLSHELRTPLTLILGPLGSLLDGRHGALPPSAREQHELMRRNGNRLLRLINQILDLTRLQAGAVTLDRRTHDLVGFVRAQVLAFAPLAERQRIALHFRSLAPELRVGFDAEQFEKVLLNLLSNAIKFTPPGGEVEVSLAADAHAVEITVRDTGIGIAAGELPRVFERFFQADASATRRYEGTGIGLALAKELVELHGGTIRAESEPGVGSAFTVRLALDAEIVRPVTGARDPGEAAPVAVPSDVRDAARASAPALVRATVDHEEAGLVPDEQPWDEQAPDGEPPDRTTVLVVDDNPDVRAYVRSVLGGSYRVIEAGDGRAGLEVALAALPDLVVADVMMPELDGLALGRALRTDPMTDAIPLILLTARAAPEDQVAGFDSGADGYLLKPFEPSVLVAQVAGLLAQRRRLRDRFRQGEAVPPATAPSEPSPLDLRLRPLIESRLSQPGFGPDALADAAGLSYHQLYRALRDELATTPSRYIRTVRVECAAELLGRGEGSITEVAYAVGFESLSYFRRAFRERFGSSPSDHLAARGPAPLA
jgi:signal transduction histidine kinase/DNA-binding response OmpR family regulator